MTRANILLAISAVLLGIAVWFALDGFEQFRVGAISPVEYLAKFGVMLLLSIVNFMLSKKARLAAGGSNA